MIHLDGPACVMKTSILKNISKEYKCIFIDFSENVARFNNFRNKTSNPKLTLMYTLTQYAQTLEPYDFSDRSPVTDLYYFIVYELLEFIKKSNNDFHRVYAYRKFVLNHLTEFMIPKDELKNANINSIKQVLYDKMFSKYKTFFIIPSIDSIDIIYDQMVKRENGIDLLDKSFIFAQIIVFDVLRLYFNYDNFIFYEVLKENLYTDNESVRIKDMLIDFKNKNV